MKKYETCGNFSDALAGDVLNLPLGEGFGERLFAGGAEVFGGGSCV